MDCFCNIKKAFFRSFIVFSWLTCWKGNWTHAIFLSQSNCLLPCLLCSSHLSLSIHKLSNDLVKELGNCWETPEYLLGSSIVRTQVHIVRSQNLRGGNFLLNYPFIVTFVFLYSFWSVLCKLSVHAYNFKSFLVYNISNFLNPLCKLRLTQILPQSGLFLVPIPILCNIFILLIHYRNFSDYKSGM